MIFYIHGWHKLQGGVAYLEHGIPWKLAHKENKVLVGLLALRAKAGNGEVGPAKAA